ncbi:MAG TPA: hypothetical protein VF498_18345, partial [Anaerolineales bacterium]
ALAAKTANKDFNTFVPIFCPVTRSRSPGRPTGRIPGTEFYQQNWSATFNKLLFLLSAASLFLFFRPL